MKQETAQHTPGPWHIQGSGILLHPVTQAALTTTRFETSLGSFEVLDETNEPDANARLIAAAPLLLEALQAMLDARVDPMGIKAAEADTKARAAIAAAQQ